MGINTEKAQQTVGGKVCKAQQGHGGFAESADQPCVAVGVLSPCVARPLLRQNITEQEEQQQAPPLEIPKAEEIIEIVDNDAKVEETVIQASDETEKAVEVKYTPVVVEEEEPEEQQIFQIVEEMPEFPGGMGECLKFLMKNAKYPTISQENGVQGKVSVKFVIEKDGSVADPVVVRGVDPYLDKEALRVVKTMPKWKPGKQRGKPVRVSYTVPVIFKLQ